MDTFLVIVAVIIVLLVNKASGAVAKERGRIGDATLSAAGHQLSHYELAYLSGGPRRAINTALAVLATAGAVRVSRGAQVTPVAGARPSSDPLERAIMDALQGRGGYRAAELRHALDGHPAVRAIEDGLRARGLLLHPSAFAPAERKLALLKAAVLLAGAFEVTAVVLGATGVAGKQLQYGGALLFGGFAIITGLIEHHREKRRLRHLVTGEGRRVLDAAKQHHPRGLYDTSSLAMAVAVPVALYGLTELGDGELREELSTGDPGTDSSGSCGSYSDSSDSGFGCGGDFGGRHRAAGAVVRAAEAAQAAAEGRAADPVPDAETFRPPHASIGYQ